MNNPSVIKIEKLLKDYSKFKMSLDDYESQHTSKFNIFKILRQVDNDEERTHSPFLSYLLDIHGKHCQSALFFDGFLNNLNFTKKNKIDFTPDELIFFVVSKEFWIGNGSIDILITYNDGKKKFAIAIENKINAGDQPKQLERYNNYFKNQYGPFYILIYLTKSGTKPSQKSIREDLYLELINSENIQLISYNYHIKSWLKNTISKIKSKKVEFIVEQYLELIKYF